MQYLNQLNNYPSIRMCLSLRKTVMQGQFIQALTLLLLSCFLFLNWQAPSYALAANEPMPPPSKQEPWIKRMTHRFKQIWHNGSNDLYLDGYAWHNRYLYTKDRLAIGQYNEQAWGGGFGRGLYDEDGDWQGLYAMAFLDSHRNVEPAIGYGFLKMLHLKNKTKLGAGFTIFGTMRPDILNGYPFPAVTPLVNITQGRLSIFAAYVPGHQNIGNVLFVFGKWSFSDQI